MLQWGSAETDGDATTTLRPVRNLGRLVQSVWNLSEKAACKDAMGVEETCRMQWVSSRPACKDAMGAGLEETRSRTRVVTAPPSSPLLPAPSSQCGSRALRECLLLLQSFGPRRSIVGWNPFPTSETPFSATCQPRERKGVCFAAAAQHDPAVSSASVNCVAG